MKITHFTLITCCLTSLAAAKEFNSAVVTQKINDVKILHKSKKARVAKIKDILNTNNMLQTGRRSRAELTFPDKSISRLGANTSFSFRNRGRNLQLENGSMLLQVPKNAGGATIYTSSVTAAITGTTILFEYNRGKWIKLISLEGKVSITTKKAGTIKLKPGQMVFLKEDGGLLAKPVDVDLKRLVATAGLLNEKQFGPLPNDASQKIRQAIVTQQRDLAKGVLTRQRVTKREPLSRVSNRVQRGNNDRPQHSMYDTPTNTIPPNTDNPPPTRIPTFGNGITDNP